MEPRVLTPQGGEEYIPFAKAHWRNLVASGDWKKTLHTGDCIIIITRDEILILKQAAGNFVCYPRAAGKPPSMDDGTTVEVGDPRWEAEAAGYQYGNLDWKGTDEQVLTWRGPTDRYGLNQPLFTAQPGFTHPEEHNSGAMTTYQSFYWPFVFQDGEIVAMAPPIPEGSNAAETLYTVGGEDIDVTARYHVLGAGIFGGSIVAVVAGYRQFRAYLLQQTGFSEWKTLYTFTRGELERPWKPWFFSASGSKAVSVQGDQYRILTLTKSSEEITATKDVFSAAITPSNAVDNGSSYTSATVNEFPAGTGAAPPLSVNCKKSEPCWDTSIAPYDNKEVGEQYDYLTKFKLEGKRITAADWKGEELAFAVAEQSGESSSEVHRRRTTVWGATAQNDGISDHAASAALGILYSSASNDPISIGQSFTAQLTNICPQDIAWSIVCDPTGAAYTFSLNAAKTQATITGVPANCCAGNSGRLALATATVTVMSAGGHTYTATKKVRLPQGQWVTVTDFSKTPPAAAATYWNNITFKNSSGGCADTDGGISCATKQTYDPGDGYRYTIQWKDYIANRALRKLAFDGVGTWLPATIANIENFTNCTNTGFTFLVATTVVPPPCGWVQCGGVWYAVTNNGNWGSPPPWTGCRNFGSFWGWSAPCRSLPNGGWPYSQLYGDLSEFAGAFTGWRTYCCVQKWVCP